MSTPPDSPPGGWGYANKVWQLADEQVPHIPGVISIDLRPMIRAFNKIAKNPRVQRAVRMHNDLESIRQVADRERASARRWLDQRMDDMYDDLGLVRYPDIPF